jgi:hypothetical protein
MRRWPELIRSRETKRFAPVSARNAANRATEDVFKVNLRLAVECFFP